MSLRGLRLVPLVSLVLVVLALARAIGTAPAARLPPPPRNVILVSLDTLRADHLGSWGYGPHTSPHLDELARRSVVFQRAVAQGSSTIPSHASLFTSQYPSAVVGLGGGLLDAPRTLAEVLAAEGFATWGFVDGGNVRAHFGFGQGFQHYEDDRVGIRRLVGRAERWIARHPVPRFFLFLHTYQIHTPYRSPSQYVKLFGDPTYLGRFVPDTRYFRAIERSGRKMRPRERREVVARYDAGIRYTDDYVGRFLDWLEERGLLADSLVVLVSDHGEEFREHGRLGHYQLYLDPNIRVPLIFYRQNMRPRVVDRTVELADVVPTILDVLGLPPLPEAVGRSLVPDLLGAPSSTERVAYSESGGRSGKHTVVTDRYQLLVDRKSGSTRLFDLREDAAAQRDVAAERPEVTARLTEELDRRRIAAKHTRTAHYRTQRQQRRAHKGLPRRIRRELETLGYIDR